MSNSQLLKELGDLMLGSSLEEVEVLVLLGRSFYILKLECKIIGFNLPLPLNLRIVSVGE